MNKQAKYERWDRRSRNYTREFVLRHLPSTQCAQPVSLCEIKCKSKYSFVLRHLKCAQPLSFHRCHLPSNQLVQAHKDLQIWFSLVFLTTLFDEGGHGDPEERKAEGVHLHEGS